MTHHPAHREKASDAKNAMQTSHEIKSAGDSDPLMDPRLLRERQTVVAMLGCYCRGVHGTRSPLCDDCRALLDYATSRLQRCRFGGDKPVCAKCPMHCYQPRMRDAIKQVMRYAGPRMLVRHPVLTLRHWWDARRQ